MSISQQQQRPLALVEPAVRDAAIRALEERGVIGAAELVALSTPIKVLAWCRWWDTQRGVRVALLVSQIQAGEEPPIVTGSERPFWAQPGYGERVTEWLKANLPEVCDANGTPHWVARHEVFQIHFRDRRPSEYVHVIRAAVEVERRAEAGA